MNLSSPTGVADGLDVAAGLGVGTDAEAELPGVGDPVPAVHATSARHATRQDQEMRIMTCIGYFRGDSPTTS